jgi:hypothetical protein
MGDNGPCWELEFKQSSFHHASRVLRREPYIALGRPPLSAHAIVPSGFHLQVRAVAQETFLEFPPHYVGFTVARRTARSLDYCSRSAGCDTRLVALALVHTVTGHLHAH